MSKEIKANKKNIWVLGATGYVGQLVSRRLFSEREKGNWSGQLITLGQKTIIPWIMERTNFHLFPLNSIPQMLLKRYTPSAIYHCARMAGNSDRARRIAARKGYAANQRLIHLIQGAQTKIPIVYCSGTLMYGNTVDRIDEDAPLLPIAYARAYEYAERPWVKAAGTGEMDVRIARPGWILGPDSWFEHFFYKPALRNGKVPIYGDGNQYMSIISVEDCAGQLTHLMERGLPNQSANLFGFEPIKQKDFALLVAQFLETTTMEISASETKNSFGQTVLEALTSSTPVTTKHKKWRSAYKPLHTDLAALVESTIRRLQAKS
jgi:nucleoside-diphosphate-sugar epimerase